MGHGGREREEALKQQSEILMLLTEALSRHAGMRAVTLSALIRAVMDIFLGTGVRAWGTEAVRGLLSLCEKAKLSAGETLLGVLKANALGDYMLDIFMGEWEVQREPAPRAFAL